MSLVFPPPSSTRPHKSSDKPRDPVRVFFTLSCLRKLRSHTRPRRAQRRKTRAHLACLQSRRNTFQLNPKEKQNPETAPARSSAHLRWLRVRLRHELRSGSAHRASASHERAQSHSWLATPKAGRPRNLRLHMHWSLTRSRARGGGSCDRQRRSLRARIGATSYYPWQD